MPDITLNTLALVAAHIAASLVAATPPVPPTTASLDPALAPVLKGDPIPVNPPTVEPDPALVAIAQQSVLLARLIGDEVVRTEPIDLPAPLPFVRETRRPT